MPYKDGNDVGSNLSSSVLREIVLTLGLNFAPFEPLGHLIDERLSAQRNTIAHGEYLEIDEASFEEVTDDVVAMLDAFRGHVDNAVALGTYRAQAPI